MPDFKMFANVKNHKLLILSQSLRHPDTPLKIKPRQHLPELPPDVAEAKIADTPLMRVADFVIENKHAVFYLLRNLSVCLPEGHTVQHELVYHLHGEQVAVFFIG